MVPLAPMLVDGWIPGTSPGMTTAENMAPEPLMDIKIPQTLAEWNAAGAAYLPGYLGLTFLKVEPQEVIA